MSSNEGDLHLRWVRLWAMCLGYLRGPQVEILLGRLADMGAGNRDEIRYLDEEQDLERRVALFLAGAAMWGGEHGVEVRAADLDAEARYLWLFCKQRLESRQGGTPAGLTTTIEGVQDAAQQVLGQRGRTHARLLFVDTACTLIKMMQNMHAVCRSAASTDPDGKGLVIALAVGDDGSIALRTH